MPDDFDDEQEAKEKAWMERSVKGKILTIEKYKCLMEAEIKALQ